MTEGHKLRKRMIDIENIDRRRISILCKSHHNIDGIKDFFKAKGFRVDIETSVTNFFSHLQDIRPGFVLVSKSIESSMAKELPEFLQKKFKIPVILFQEIIPEIPTDNEKSQHTKNDLTVNKVNVSGIVHVGSNSEIEIHNELLSFESLFEKMTLEKEVAKELSPSNIKKDFELGHLVMNQISQQIEINDISFNEVEKIQVFSFCVQDPQGEGHFFFALPVKPDQKDTFDTIKKLATDITNSLGIDAKIENVSTKVNHSLFKDLQKKSDRAITGFFGSQEISVSYFEGSPARMEEEISIKGSSFLVPVEQWWTHLALNFRAYLWLEKNNKKILYLKKGYPLSESALSKFKDFSVEKMMIHPDDLPMYKIQKRMIYFATLGVDHMIRK
jgi:hypothetical protein